MDDTRRTGGGEHGGAFRRILVGFDGSREAQEALRAAVALGDELRGEVRVLLVVRPPAHVETPEELASAAAAERDNLSRGLAPYRRATGRDVDRRVVFADDPARALSDHAEEHGFDIVVVGCHGRDHATHRGIGASVEALLRRHPCPVLVV
jgi:nucleotide-binding universal stress UspA family protein